jgi:methionine salvage enolase-phosphatase E1
MDVFIKVINSKTNFVVMDTDYTNWERSDTNLMMQDETPGLHFNKWIKQMLKGLTFTIIQGYTWMSTYETNQRKIQFQPKLENNN